MKSMFVCDNHLSPSSSWDCDSQHLPRGFWELALPKFVINSFPLGVIELDRDIWPQSRVHYLNLDTQSLQCFYALSPSP